MKSELKKLLLGYGLMVFNKVMRVSSATAVQVLGRAVPDFQLSALRYIGAFLFGALLVYFNKTKLDLPKESYIFVLLVTICSMGVNNLDFFAVSIVPLSHVSISLVFIVIIIAIISKILFDKSPNIIISVCIFGSIVGTICLVQPWLDFTHGFTARFIAPAANHSVVAVPSTSNNPVTGRSAWWLVLGYLALVGAAVFESFFILLAGIYMRKIKPALLVLVVSSLAIPLCIVSSFYLEEPVLITDANTILLLVVHVAGSVGCLYSQVVACRMISPIHIAIIGNLETVLSLVLQYTLLGTYLYGRKNVLEVVGCILIISSITLSAMFNNEEKHEDFEKDSG